MQRTLFTVATLVLLMLCARAGAAFAENYQIQLGSTKSLESAKYFTGRASRVLGCETFIVKSGKYYVAVTGSHATREKAMAELMRIAKHYTAFISTYDERDIIAMFSEGKEITSDELKARNATAGRVPEPIDEPLKQQPIRSVGEKEAVKLDKVIENALVDVSIDNCALKNVTSVQGLVFTTACNLKDLDPFAIKTEARHGKNVYLRIPVQGNQKKVSIEERAENAVIFTRSDATLLVRSKNTDYIAVDKLKTAFRELINHCAKGGK